MKWLETQGTSMPLKSILEQRPDVLKISLSALRGKPVAKDMAELSNYMTSLEEIVAETYAVAPRLSTLIQDVLYHATEEEFTELLKTLVEMTEITDRLEGMLLVPEGDRC